MTATYTFDIFSSLDGYGSYREPGDWGRSPVAMPVARLDAL